ncbi:plasmid pRiA4b ORF-3 family protein [Streptomyces sp. NPDC006333]|uniref:plasmid pRiA4b ORF-3 family protein n=1 Tax=Streptomyces sp. NPDC006333 TaxID=3156753 RepID=UPI0033B34374
MRPDGKTAPSDLQLKIVLQGTRPPLWRRLVLPSDTSLGTLHNAIQVAFGWHGGHLHLFTDEFGRGYGDAARLTDIDLGFGRVGGDEEATALGDVLAGEGARLRYVYDFGDDWEHGITLEKALPRPVGAGRTVRCVGGRRADVPAEDIGGCQGWPRYWSSSTPRTGPGMARTVSWSPSCGRPVTTRRPSTGMQSPRAWPS